MPKADDNTISPAIQKLIKEVRIIDDVFMSLFFNNDKATMELVVKTILGKDDLTIQKARTQFKLENIGRSVQIDVLAIDSKGTLYDIEIQRSATGASPKRLRYHSAMLDVSYLKSGADFEKLPEKYIIFITEGDYFKKGEPIYSFANTLISDKHNLSLGDGQHYLYVDATNHADTPLGKLMHDFMERDPERMYYETLKKRANYFKNTKEGANTMGNLSEKLRAEGRAEGIKALATYLKKSATKSEAIKTLMGAYGLSESEALSTYSAA